MSQKQERRRAGDPSGADHCGDRQHHYHETQQSASGQRPRPDDFEQRLIEFGRDALECHYGAARRTIDRWLRESGAEQLVRRRADYVRSQQARKRDKAVVVLRTRSPQPLQIERDAAHFLRHPDAGGLIIFPGQGRWWLNSKWGSAEDLLALARSKGWAA